MYIFIMYIIYTHDVSVQPWTNPMFFVIDHETQITIDHDHEKIITELVVPRPTVPYT